MRAYLLKRQNAVAQYIAKRPILDLCGETVQRYRAWVARIWWDQEGLELAGSMAGTAEDREG